MNLQIFCKHLALERCRQNLGQLCSLIHLSQHKSHASYAEGACYEQLIALVQTINRDLEAVGEICAQNAGGSVPSRSMQTMADKSARVVTLFSCEGEKGE